METTTGMILLAEGDPVLRDLIVAALGRLFPGCQMITAGNGQEALALAGRHRPQLLLIDLLLPQLNGLEVMRQVRDQTRGDPAPIIAISALGFHEVVQQAVSAGAVDFLVKPFDVNLLASKVQRALAREI